MRDELFGRFDSGNEVLLDEADKAVGMGLCLVVEVQSGFLLIDPDGFVVCIMPQN